MIWSAGLINSFACTLGTTATVPCFPSLPLTGRYPGIAIVAGVVDGGVATVPQQYDSRCFCLTFVTSEKLYM